ncbi:hypothetical protein CBM2595_A80076 [Cupriavidus taiwanensis]|nr:hypothetical protein CBM2595_A80076 [Cupriavidus taiwanensis]
MHVGCHSIMYPRCLSRQPTSFAMSR